MNHARKAMAFAFIAVLILAMLLANALMPILRVHWRYLVYGPVSPGSRFTNLEAFGILAAAVFLLFARIAFMVSRQWGVVEAGRVSEYAQRDVGSGMPGMKGLKDRLAR